MKIICVSGGSYKSCYLNFLQKIKSCDLLILNYGVLYTLDYAKINEFDIVKDEMRMLSSRLHCKIVAGVFVKSGDRTYQSILLLDNNSLEIFGTHSCKTISVKNHKFSLCTNGNYSANCDKIILSTKRIHPNLSHCSRRRKYIFCDNFGVTIVEKKKLKRKFYKYSKIILK